MVGTDRNWGLRERQKLRIEREREIEDWERERERDRNWERERGESLTFQMMGHILPPFSFFNISPEPLRRSSPNFQYPLVNSFYSLWTKFFPKAIIGWALMTSEWHHFCHFRPKKKGFAGGAVRPTALEIHKNVSDIKDVESKGLQNGYLGFFRFLKFLDFDPQK